jgi:hypothetical protein
MQTEHKEDKSNTRRRIRTMLWDLGTEQQMLQSLQQRSGNETEE